MKEEYYSMEVVRVGNKPHCGLGVAILARDPSSMAISA